MSDLQIHLPNNWKARPYQQKLWKALRGGTKRAVAIWHRRAGKDEIGLHFIAVASHTPGKIGTYWHMLPEARQARRAIWDAVNSHTGKRRIDEAFPLELREVTRENEMFIKFKNGSTYQVVGSDNYDSLIGAGVLGIVYSEWALSKPGSWSFLRPILLENDGWALFISTPRGRNHCAQMYEDGLVDPEWYAEKLTVDDTGLFTEEQLARELMETQRELGEKPGSAMYNQEYMCDFDAPQIGSVYAELMADLEKDDRFTEVKWVPNKPVFCGYDLGRSDSTSIWFFQVGPGAVYFIDFYESSGEDVDHYAKVIHDKPYVYKDHYFPWDARVVSLAAKNSVLEQMSDLGVRGHIVKGHHEHDRIAAGRALLRRSYFDREACKDGLAALRDYHYTWDEDKHKLSDKAYHGWSSHAADAFGYAAMGYSELNPAPFKSSSAQLNRLPTMGEITRAHDRAVGNREQRIM